MNRIFISVLLLCLCSLIFCSCVRTGEKDSIDFVSSMAKYGFDLSAEEIISADTLKESYYSGDCKITVCSDENGKMYRLILTYYKSVPKEFYSMAKGCIMSFSGIEETLALEIMNTLGISHSPAKSTMGVNRCESGFFLFSFTADNAGGCLVIDSLRLNPTSSPTVTLRETVPEVTLPEKSSTS